MSIVQVDLTLNELTEVSFGKAILFAKVFVFVPALPLLLCLGSPA